MTASNKQPHLYELGQTVRTPRGEGRVVGIEWGGDLRKSVSREWVYTVCFGPWDDGVFAEEQVSAGRRGHALPYV